jgi:hypothetical protein
MIDCLFVISERAVSVPIPKFACGTRFPVRAFRTPRNDGQNAGYFVFPEPANSASDW